MSLTKMACGTSTTTDLIDNINSLVNFKLGSGSKNLGLIRVGDKVYIGHKLGGAKDLYYAFDYKGVNNLYSCNGGYKLANASALPSLAHDFLAATRFFGDIDTDWVGPYIVKKVAESTSTLFTGGHHAKDGSTNPAGVPSAESLGYTLIADGKEITGDFSGLVSTVTITTSNLVQSGGVASNDDNVLRQDVEYTITDAGVAVGINTTALVDVRLDRFYGVQTYARANYSEIRFFGDKTATGSLLPTAAGNAELASVVRSVGHIDIDGDVLASFVNNGQLGNFAIKGAANPYATRSNYKTYFNLVNAFTTMLAGASLYVTGGWSYTKSATKSGSTPQGKCMVILPKKGGCSVVSDFYGVTSGNRDMRILLPQSLNGAVLTNSPVIANGLTFDNDLNSYTQASSLSTDANAITVCNYVKI